MISRSTNEDVGFAGLDPAQLPQPYNFDPFLGSGEQWQVGDSGPAER